MDSQTSLLNTLWKVGKYRSEPLQALLSNKKKHTIHRAE